MHVQKNKSSQQVQQTMTSRVSEKGANELSYSNMVMNQNGTLLRQEEVKQLREQQGFCPTCVGTPVKLFEVRKTKLNPLWKSKEPLTVPNESYNGQCLKCHPNKAAGSSTFLRTSMLTTQTQGTSTVSSFVDGKLTVTKYEGDSQDMSAAVLKDPVGGSSDTKSARESLVSRPTQGADVEHVSKDYSSVVGKSSHPLSDSRRSSGSPAVRKPLIQTESFGRSKSPPRVLAGNIPMKAVLRKGPLDSSRRNSEPVVSAALPPIASMEHKDATMKASPRPSPGGPHSAHDSPLHPTARRASAPVKQDFSSVALKPDPKRKFIARAARRSHGRHHQAAETMNQLRIACENTSSMDDISALTLDIEPSGDSATPPKSGNSEGASDGSDSLLEEFSVPDFSMGTGKAVKTHRKQSKSSSNAKGKVSPPRKIGPVDDHIACKPKADATVHKPQPSPASYPTPPKTKDFVTNKKYTMMVSGVSALPGPPDTRARVEEPSFDSPREQRLKPADCDTAGDYQQERELPIKSAEGFASGPWREDGFALVPPLLLNMPGTMGELTAEAKTAGGVASLDSKVEEVTSLINDVMAAGNAEFLAELLCNTMRSHREQEDIQSLCLHTIWETSKYNDENKSSIMATGLYDCIISAMKDFPDSVQVQGNGCGALWSLAVNQFNRVILVRAGACERILRALDTHLNTESFVQTAFGALRTVSPDREARLVLNHMLGTQRVVRAMALHRFAINIQRDGCAILSNVAVDMDSQEVSVVSREELQAVVRAMRDNLKTESVITSACFALKNFSYEERNVRNLKRLEDVISVLEDAAQYATKASCRRDAAEVLTRIQMLETEDATLEETVFSSLMQAMRRTNTEKNPAKQVEESVSTITEVIQEYYWSIRLICFGLESLLSLADKSEAHTSRVLSPKTLRMVVNTMKEHKLNPLVQQRGCELLRFLAEPDKPVNRMEICMEEGCSVIICALRNHHGDESVEIPAYTALRALSHEPLCAEEIERSGGWQIMMEHDQALSSGANGFGDALGRHAEAEAVAATAHSEETDFALRCSTSC